MSESEKVITNWAGNVTFGCSEFAEPTSLDELRAVVARSGRVRVLGGGHSFSPLADTTGTLISLSHLASAEPELDTERGTVRVPAGYTYHQLVSWLHGSGWTVPNTASLPHILVVGACCTATHGSGNRNGNLATGVRALTLVTGDGDLITTERGDPDFEGAVVSLGALGVVVDLTLDLVPAFDVRQHLYQNLPLEALAENFDEISAAAYSVSLFPISWNDPIEQVWLKQRPEESAPDQVYGAPPASVPLSPIPGQDPAVNTEQLGTPGPAHTRLPHFRPDVTPSSGSELQSEYLLPREHAVSAIRAVHELRARVGALSWCSEIRTIAADRLWLSPAYQRDLVALHFTWRYDPPAVAALLPVLEGALLPYQPLPHWGKLHTMSPETIRAGYPRLSEFVDLAARLDPNGTFRNAFLDRYVLGD